MLSQSQPFADRCGLLWWRRAAQSWLYVDASGLDVFAKAGVASTPLNKIRGLLGGRFKDAPHFLTELKRTLGTDLLGFLDDIDARQLIMDDLVVVDRASGPVVAYEARGDRGQYIVVVPKAQLVAVRQIGDRSIVRQDESWPYGYPDFPQRVLALARSLGGIGTLDEL